MKSLRISDDLHLPLEAVTNTHLILARRRVGKSYTAAVMAEEMVKAGLPWVAHDPTGVWWGLTSSANGKSEGLPVIVIGGPHGHIPLEPSAGKVIANLVVDHPGWYVIDYSRFDHRADEIRFAADFGVQLYRRKQRKPSALHIFLDEADMFVPQKLPKNAKPMLDAYDAIVRRGGVYGLGITLISQRPALVNTDVRTQCETLIALQTTAPLDQDPIFDWVSRNGTDEQLKQIKKTLASLTVGQAWFFSPDSDVFRQIKIRERETFNSSATPKPGANPIEPKVFASINIEKLGADVAATVERSRQEDPEYLRRQIEQLRRQLAAKPSAAASAEPQIVEVPIVPAEQIQSLEELVLNTQRVSIELDGMFAHVKELLNGKFDQLQHAAQSISTAFDQAKQIRSAPRVTAVTAPATARPALTVTPTLVPAAPAEGLTSPQQRILDAVAWLESIGLYNPKRTIIAFLAGQSPKSSGFTNNLGALRSAGLITYPGSDSLAFTDAGRAAARPQKRPLTTADLQHTVLSRLPRPQARILEVLIENYPDPVNREELAARAGQSPRSSGYTNNLGALRSLGVIDYPSSSEAVALPVLFLERA
jgi:hypothetical protein